MQTNGYELIENANGDYKLDASESVLRALAKAVEDGSCTIQKLDSAAGPYFRVELLDGDEWGDGATLDDALRYALGAHFAP